MHKELDKHNEPCTICLFFYLISRVKVLHYLGVRYSDVNGVRSPQHVNSQKAS